MGEGVTKSSREREKTENTRTRKSRENMRVYKKEGV